VTYTGSHSDDAYWRGFNDGIAKLAARLSEPTDG
jgi:hypothetical protein